MLIKKHKIILFFIVVLILVTFMFIVPGCLKKEAKEEISASTEISSEKTQESTYQDISSEAKESESQISELGINISKFALKFTKSMEILFLLKQN
jgi:hypothetical protein